jgi:hypothetical protein
VRVTRAKFVAILIFLLASCWDPAAPTSAVRSPLGTQVTGTVVERIDGAPYSFLRLRTAEGHVWVAVPIGTGAGTQPVTVTRRAELKAFASKTASRTFEDVMFGTVAPAQ